MATNTLADRTTRKVLRLIGRRVVRTLDLRRKLGLDSATVAYHLTKLQRTGKIVRVERGRYQRSKA